MIFRRFGAGVLGVTIITAGLLTVGPSAGRERQPPPKRPSSSGTSAAAPAPRRLRWPRRPPPFRRGRNTSAAHGGIQGHPVSIIVKDDGYNPTTSLAAAQTLVGTDHVVAIVDNSDVDTSWGPYVKEQGVAVVGGSESDEGYENPDWFVPGATYNNFTAGIAYAAKELHVKKMADVYCAEVAVCAQSSTDLKTALTKLDIDLAYTSAISFSAPSYTAYCLAAKQSGATALLVGDATAIVNKFVAGLHVAGLQPHRDKRGRHRGDLVADDSRLRGQRRRAAGHLLLRP